MATIANTSYAAVAQRGTTCIAGEGTDLAWPKAAGRYLPSLTPLRGVSPWSPEYSRLSEWSIYRRWPGGIDLRLPFVVEGGAQLGTYYGLNLPSGWSIGANSLDPDTWGILSATAPAAGTYEYWIVHIDQEFKTWTWHCQTVVTAANDANDDAWFAFVDSSRAGNAGNDGSRNAAWGTFGEAYANVIAASGSYATNLNYTVALTPATKKTLVFLDSAAYVTPTDIDSSAGICGMGPNKFMSIIGASPTSRPTFTMTTTMLSWNKAQAFDIAVLNVICDGDVASPLDHCQLNFNDARLGRIVYNCDSINANQSGTASNCGAFGTTSDISNNGNERAYAAVVNCTITVPTTFPTSARFYSLLDFSVKHSVHQNIRVTGDCDFLNSAGWPGKHWGRYYTGRWLDYDTLQSNALSLLPEGSHSVDGRSLEEYYFEFCKLKGAAAGSAVLRHGGSSPSGRVTWRRCTVYGVIGTASTTAALELRHENNVVVNSAATGFVIAGSMTETAGTGDDADIVQNSGSNTILDVATMELLASWESGNPTLVDRVGATWK